MGRVKETQKGKVRGHFAINEFSFSCRVFPGNPSEVIQEFI